jgi:hypothetical protein
MLLFGDHPSKTSAEARYRGAHPESIATLASGPKMFDLKAQSQLTSEEPPRARPTGKPEEDDVGVTANAAFSAEGLAKARGEPPQPDRTSARILPEIALNRESEEKGQVA